jgi:hypothetical protein
MGCGLQLARHAQQLFALFAVRQLVGLALEGFRLLAPLLFEGQLPTHDPPLRNGGSATGLSVTDGCRDCAVMPEY